MHIDIADDAAKVAEWTADPNDVAEALARERAEQPLPVIMIKTYASRGPPDGA